MKTTVQEVMPKTRHVADEVEEQRRQEEREVETGGQGEENTRTWMTMWMGVKVQDSNLSQM